jgi:type VI secretion system secreted protein VgrG
MLMGEHGLKAPVIKGIVTDPAPQHYSVQFNETDLAYLTRRLEEDGIFHWFEHEGGAMGAVAATHTLHIASDVSGYTTGPETDIRFAMGSTDRNHISKFEKRFRFVPGKRSAADWNFLTPGGPAQGNTPSLVKLPKNEDYELYEYPSIGGYGTDSASDAISNARVEQQSRLRMQAAEVEHERIEGHSNVRTLSPARRFKPYDVANPGNVFEEHVIAEIIHTARDRSYETNAGDPEYNNAFTAIPSRVPATPHRVTPRPRIDGTQIALVAGPEGEEIHPDEYGRIKLWFPWDRKAKKDGSDTCWVRVTQNWAGAGWGGQIIPRIGMEVMVTYLDGDPDRPVVTGVVPNPRQKVPYALPANKTKAVLRTDTHKAAGFNELSFEDESGREEVFLHAQKDMSIRVLNDRVKRVDANQIESVGGNFNVDVARNIQQKTGGSVSESVGGMGAPLLSILGGLVAAGGKDSVNGTAAIENKLLNAFVNSVAAVGAASEVASLGANGAFSAAGGHKAAAGKEQTKTGSAIGSLLSSLMPVSGILNKVIEKFRSDTIGIARTEQIGVYKNTTVGHTMTLNIGEEFIIKCGESKMMMDKKGNVTIVGAKFNFAASGHVQINGKVIDLN